MVFKNIFLSLTVTVRFLKKIVLQKREFSSPFFQSTIYNNVVVARQISCLSTFLKS